VHDTSPEVAKVERYVATRQGDGGKPTLQLDVTSFSFLLTLCLLIAQLDDITEHLLEEYGQLYRHIRLVFHQELRIYLTYLSDVDLLNLEEVQDIGHVLQHQKLRKHIVGPKTTIRIRV
jgi:hypothetical protein